MEKITVPFQNLPGKTVGLALITPDLAKSLLSLNIKNNRRISSVRVESYARDMRDDKFAETTMITIDENGRLIDGQHRLHAVIKAQWFVVFIGAHNNQYIFDRGLQRTTAQNAKMAGMLVCDNITLGMLRLHFAIYSKSPNQRVNDAQIMEYIEDNNDILLRLSKIIPSTSSTLTSRSAVRHGVFQALRCGVSEDVLASFCKAVNSGFVENPNQNAAIAFRNQNLANPPVGSIKKRMEAAFACEWAIQYYAAHRNWTKALSNNQGPYTAMLPEV